MLCLSIRLHTKSVKKYEDVLKSEYKSTGNNPVSSTTISRSFGNGKVFSLTDLTNRPEWAGETAILTNNKVDISNNSFSKAVAVFKVESGNGKKRFMSLTFGRGDSLLDSVRYINDFGRNVAAKKISGFKVTATDSFQITDRIIQSAKQYVSMQNVGIEALINSQSEFASSISGNFTNGEIETRLHGHDELLKATRFMGWDEVKNDLQYYLNVYLSRATMAGWATRVTKINGGLKQKLDSALIKGMISGRVEYAIAWSTFREVNLLTTTLLKRIPDISPTEQLSWYIKYRQTKDPNYNSDQLSSKIKQTKLVATVEGDQPENIPLYRGILADLVFEKQRYLLYNGKWYQVEQQFYDEIVQKITNIPVCNIELPELKVISDKAGTPHYEDEGSYNIRLANSVIGGTLFDKVNFNAHLGSDFRGPEEPADVITTSRNLFFVKKGNSSAALSHLFLQGLVSAKLLAQGGTGELRRFVNEKLNADVFTDNIRNTDVTLTFVVIKKTPNLPFFSMISFSEVLDGLYEMGYKVEIAWPKIEELS